MRFASATYFTPQILPLLRYIPLLGFFEQVTVTLYLLYTQLHWAFLAGVCILVAFTPLNVLVSRRIGSLTGVMMTHRDVRIRVTGELLSGIRSVKALAWEMPLLTRIRAARALEFRALAARKYLDAVCVFLWASTPGECIIVDAVDTARAFNFSGEEVCFYVAIISPRGP